MPSMIHALGRQIRKAYVVVFLWAVTAFTVSAQPFTVLQNFYVANGKLPAAGLTKASDGNFYGTTYQGGGANGDYGTVFKITPSGTLTTLYRFCAQSGCKDGQLPEGALVQATDGNLYGITSGGGANGNYGTVFKITLSGTLTTLHSFCAQSKCTDGKLPYAGLLQAANGDLYGTTSGGGANGDYGTIFRITTGGALTTIYSFCGRSECADGEAPEAALIQASNGNLYGTSGQSEGYGTVFTITPSGTLTTLHARTRDRRRWQGYL